MSTLQYSTALVGPYDALPTTHKTTVSCMIPYEVKERMFTHFLPYRGATDKLLARLIYLIDGYVSHNTETISALPAQARELFINNLINTIIDHLVALEPSQLLELHD